MIISNNVINQNSNSILVAPLTSKIYKNLLPTHLFIGKESGLRVDSVALFEKIRSIDKRLLHHRIGLVDKARMQSAIRSFVNITNLEDINLEAQARASSRHHFFRHYTSVEALAHIFSEERFRLTCLASKGFNDPIEEEWLDSFRKNRIFALSFTHETKERIPLWKMYCPDSNGVCIETTSIHFLCDKDAYQAPPPNWEIRDVRSIDIEYKDNKAEESSDGSAPIELPNSQGARKTKIWQFEEETRVRCYIGTVEHKSNLLGVSASESETEEITTEITNPGIDYMYCRVNRNDLLSLKIRFHPNMAEPVKKLIIGGIRSIQADFPIDNFLDSELKDKVRLVR